MKESKYFAETDNTKGSYQIYKKRKFLCFKWNQKVGRESVDGDLPYRLTLLELGEDEYKKQYGEVKVFKNSEI